MNLQRVIQLYELHCCFVFTRPLESGQPTGAVRAFPYEMIILWNSPDHFHSTRNSPSRPHATL